MTWLAGENSRIEVPLGSEVSVRVSNMPITFTSPVSYIEPEKKQTAVILDEEDDEDEEDEEYKEGEGAE
jgi:hypothetical protein